jgi:hypothetical protein
MPHRLRRALPFLAVLVACAVSAAAASATAMVETRELRIELNAAFQPRSLPIHSYAPVQFEGSVEVSKPGGGVPPALDQIVLDFDRDGRLDVAGLPTCTPESIEHAGVEEARAICKGAIVGSGQIEALVAVGGGAVRTGSAMTLFNGPLLEGHPTVIIHARTELPTQQTYAIVVPIEKRRGEFRYRVTINLPPIANGLGAITKITAKVGRRYTAGGIKRSYVAARCSDHILRSHGIFGFANGLVIEGVGLEKYCAQR